MDGIIEFLKSMTFWNWISLIAFIFFPLSALNAFFSLRTRYLDWNGTRSKRKFEKRVKQIQQQLLTVQGYRESVTSLVVEITLHIGLALYGFFFAFIFFLVTFLDPIIPPPSKAFVSLTLIFSGTLTAIAMLAIIKLNSLVSRVRSPEDPAEEAIKLVNGAKSKGWVAEDDNTIIDSILKHKVFTEAEREKLNEFVSNLKPHKRLNTSDGR